MNNQNNAQYQGQAQAQDPYQGQAQAQNPYHGLASGGPGMPEPNHNLGAQHQGQAQGQDPYQSSGPQPGPGMPKPDSYASYQGQGQGQGQDQYAQHGPQTGPGMNQDSNTYGTGHDQYSQSGPHTGPGMNQDSNAYGTGNTGSGPGVQQPSSGHGLKDKTRGAAQVIRGAGDYVRGTALGYVDRAINTNDTKNEDIARRGREEYDRGMASFRGSQSQPGNHSLTGPGTAGSTTGGKTGGAPSGPMTGSQGAHPQTQGQFQGQPEQGAYETHPDQYQYSPKAAPRVFGDQKDTYPGHHRDDAVTSVSPNPAKMQQQQDYQGGPQMDQGQAPPSGHSSGLNTGRGDPADIPISGQPATSMRRPYSEDHEEGLQKS